MTATTDRPDDDTRGWVEDTARAAPQYLSNAAIPVLVAIIDDLREELARLGPATPTINGAPTVPAHEYRVSLVGPRPLALPATVYLTDAAADGVREVAAALTRAGRGTNTAMLAIEPVAPRCRWCQQSLTMHDPTGLWTAPRDSTTGACGANPLTGNHSHVGHHMPEEYAVPARTPSAPPYRIAILPPRGPGAAARMRLTDAQARVITTLADALRDDGVPGASPVLTVTADYGQSAAEDDPDPAPAEDTPRARVAAALAAMGDAPDGWVVTARSLAPHIEAASVTVGDLRALVAPARPDVDRVAAFLAALPPPPWEVRPEWEHRNPDRPQDIHGHLIDFDGHRDALVGLVNTLAGHVDDDLPAAQS